MELETLTDLALWRRSSYPASRAWTDEQVRGITGDQEISSPYCFSGYWLKSAKWEGSGWIGRYGCCPCRRSCFRGWTEPTTRQRSWPADDRSSR
ncbi:hypothetical protein ACFQZ4_34430 [Catellatospora coxensis]